MYLTIKNGNIQDSIGFMENLGKLKDGKYVIKERKNTRSDKQNAYLRGGVYKTIADHMGETDLDYIHGVMGQQFLLDHSKKSPYVKSTAKLNTTEFTIYIDHIKNFVSKYGIIIPSAEEFENFISN